MTPAEPGGKDGPCRRVFSHRAESLLGGPFRCGEELAGHGRLSEMQNMMKELGL